MTGRERLAVWFRSVRAFSFTASAMPCLVGATWVLHTGAPARWALLPLVVVVSVLLHAGTNLASDFHDHARGVDRPGTRGGSGVLVEGLLPPAAIRRAATAVFGAAILGGLVLALLRGWGIIGLGLLGLVGGWGYGGGPWGYKYRALGDPAVFVLMGPLMVGGTAWTLAGRTDLAVLSLSLPVGCLVTAILCANNYRDRADDRSAGVATMATVLSPAWARAEYALLVTLPFVVVGLMVGTGSLPVTALLVFVTLPRALGLARVPYGDPEGHGERVAGLDVASAGLHLGFLLLLCLGLVLPRVLS